MGRGLFDADGVEIRNPEKYISAMLQRSEGAPVAASVAQHAPIAKQARITPVAARKVSTSSGNKPKGVFHADGTKVEDPAEYVATMKAEGITIPLYDGDGKEIRDPFAYVKAMVMRGDA